MFHPEISYSEALRRGAVQQRILAVLDAQRAPGGALHAAPLSAAELAHAQQLIDAQL
jgi:hypothetical protein